MQNIHTEHRIYKENLPNLLKNKFRICQINISTRTLRWFVVFKHRQGIEWTKGMYRRKISLWIFFLRTISQIDVKIVLFSANLGIFKYRLGVGSQKGHVYGIVFWVFYEKTTKASVMGQRPNINHSVPLCQQTTFKSSCTLVRFFYLAFYLH